MHPNRQTWQIPSWWMSRSAGRVRSCFADPPVGHRARRREPNPRILFVLQVSSIKAEVKGRWKEGMQPKPRGLGGKRKREEGGEPQQLSAAAG